MKDPESGIDQAGDGDKNAELIAGVFAELKAPTPEAFAIFRCASKRYIREFRRERIRPAGIAGQWPLQGVQSGYASVASSRRKPVMLPSSAIIGC